MLGVFAKLSVSPAWWLAIVTVAPVRVSVWPSLSARLLSRTTGPIVGSYVTEAPAVTPGAIWATSTVVVTAVETLLAARLSFTCQEIVRVGALLPAAGSGAALL